MVEWLTSAQLFLWSSSHLLSQFKHRRRPRESEIHQNKKWTWLQNQAQSFITRQQFEIEMKIFKKSKWKIYYPLVYFLYAVFADCEKVQIFGTIIFVHNYYYIVLTHYWIQWYNEVKTNTFNSTIVT